MTQKQGMKAIRVLGLTVGKRDGTYRINTPDGTEATAYYTNDLQDAINTALAMSAAADSRRDDIAEHDSNGTA